MGLGCSTELPAGGPSVDLQPDAVILSEAVSSRIQVEDGLLIFPTSEREIVESLSPGKVLAGSVAPGFIRRIRRIGTDDRGLIVETSTAGVQDVIRRGTIVAEVDLGGTVRRSGLSARLHASSDESSHAFSGDLEGYYLRNAVEGLDILFKEGDVSFEPQVAFAIDIADGHINMSADLDAAVDLTVRAVVDYQGSASIPGMSFSERYLARTIPVRFQLGVLPVFGTLTFVVDCGLELDASTRLRVEAGVRSQGEATARVRFADSVSSAEGSVALDVESIGPELDAGAALSALLTVHPTVELRLYGAFMASLGAGPAVTVSRSVTSNMCSWDSLDRVEVRGTAVGRVSLHALDQAFVDEKSVLWRSDTSVQSERMTPGLADCGVAGLDAAHEDVGADVGVATDAAEDRDAGDGEDVGGADAGPQTPRDTGGMIGWAGDATARDAREDAHAVDSTIFDAAMPDAAPPVDAATHDAGPPDSGLPTPGVWEGVMRLESRTLIQPCTLVPQRACGSGCFTCPYGLFGNNVSVRTSAPIALVDSAIAQPMGGNTFRQSLVVGGNIQSGLCSYYTPLIEIGRNFMVEMNNVYGSPDSPRSAVNFVVTSSSASEVSGTFSSTMSNWPGDCVELCQGTWSVTPSPQSLTSCVGTPVVYY